MDSTLFRRRGGSMFIDARANMGSGRTEPAGPMPADHDDRHRYYPGYWNQSEGTAEQFVVDPKWVQALAAVDQPTSADATGS